MKNLFILICLFLLFSSPAIAETKNNYVGFIIGAAFPLDLESENNLTNTSLSNLDLSNGRIFGFKIGHIFSKSSFAIEFEGLLIEGTDVNNEFYYFYPDPSNPPVNIHADISIEALMVNIVIMPPIEKIYPYVGLGIGWMHFYVDNIVTILPEGYIWSETGTQYNDYGNVSDNTFGYQFIIGIGMEITENTSFNINTRFFRTGTDLKKGNDFNIETTYKTYMINIGLNFIF